jgi:uncharacterized protein
MVERTVQAVQTVAERVAETLAPRSEVLEAYVFGSVARGQAGPLSDIDVAVRLDPAALERPLAFGLDSDLAADLMRALKTDRVDLVVLNRAPPLLYHRVLRDGIRVLSRDLRATTVREAQAISRYCDFAPQLAKIELCLSRRIAAGEFGK